MAKKRSDAKPYAGAIDLLEKNESHPEIEIDKVTTPGGDHTIKGLNKWKPTDFQML